MMRLAILLDQGPFTAGESRMNDGVGGKKLSPWTPTRMPLLEATDYISKLIIDWVYLQSEEISMGMSA